MFRESTANEAGRPEPHGPSEDFGLPLRSSGEIVMGWKGQVVYFAVEGGMKGGKGRSELANYFGNLGKCLVMNVEMGQLCLDYRYNFFFK